MNIHRAREILNHFSTLKMLVVGDIIADEYLEGVSTRLSREAPIPIINQTKKYLVPGGAANPAVNARSLGASVALAGVMGQDESGSMLKHILLQYGIDISSAHMDAKRPTSSKLRVLASNNQGVIQQVARIDNIDTTPIDSLLAERMLADLLPKIAQFNCVILSDYDNGFMGLPIIDGVLEAARKQHCILTADAHGGFARFQYASAITPNEPEAEIASGTRIFDENSLNTAGAKLLEITHAESALITRGSSGMALFQQSGKITHIPARNITAADTTGAGDTVAAVFTLALAAGADPLESAELANAAGAIVVQRPGCSTTTQEELLHFIEISESEN